MSKELILKRNKKVDTYVELIKQGSSEHYALTKVNEQGVGGLVSNAEVCGVGVFILTAGICFPLYSVIGLGVIFVALGVIVGGIFSTIMAAEKLKLTKEKAFKYLSEEERLEVNEIIEENKKKKEVAALFHKNLDLFMMTYFDTYNYEMGLRIKAGLERSSDQTAYLWELVNPDSVLHKDILKKNKEEVKLVGSKV